MAQHPLVLLRDYWRLIRQQRRIVLFAALVTGFFSLLAVIQTVVVVKVEEQ